MTRRHGSLSAGSCAFEKPVVAFGVGSGEWAPFFYMYRRSWLCDQNDSKWGVPGEKEDTERWMYELQRFKSQHGENDGDGDGDTKAGRPLFSISMLPVLHPLFPQKYILAAQKGAGRCQMTSNTDLHINVFAAAHCTLERKGRRLMQEAVWLLVRT